MTRRVAQTGWRAAALVAALGLATTVQAAPAPSQACPALRWTTLGTAGGPVPTAERSEPANLLQAGGQAILVDTGDGTVDQLAKKGLDLSAVSTVFISHHHHDHTGGLAAVIGLRWMNQFPGVLTVYGPPGTKEIVDGIVASLAPQARVGFGLGTRTQPPAESVRVVEVTGGQTVNLGELTVTTVANSHFDHPGPKAANDPQSLSYRFAVGNRAITYTGDTGPSAAVTTLAKGSDLLVSEVIDLDRIVGEIHARRPDMPQDQFDQMQRHLSTHHLPAAAIGEMAASAGVGRVLLTHYAVPPGPIERSEPALRKGIGERWSGPVDLGRDLSSYDVGCRG